MISKFASWAIVSAATLTVSRWTDWHLHCCCVQPSDTLHEAPVDLLDSDLLSPGWGASVAKICWSGIGEEDDNEKKWDVLRNIESASSQNGIRNSQLVHSTQDESCRLWLQVAGVSQRPAICNKAVWCCLYVYRDELWCMTAEISWLPDMNCRFFEGMEVWWCLSQKTSRVLLETDTNNQVMMYGMPNYSHFSDSQNMDFALYKLFKCTNLDIKDTASLQIVHILQYPTSRPTT